MNSPFRLPVVRGLLLSLTGCSAILLGCSPGDTEPTAQATRVPEQGLVVTGVITDRIDGRGLEGVSIFLSSDSGEEQRIAETDGDGFYASEPVLVEQGATIVLRAQAPASSFYPALVKARMGSSTDEWELNFVQAWPVSLWAQVVRRVAREPGQPGVQRASRLSHPLEGAGTAMADVPVYYEIETGARSLLGLTDSNGELLPEPVWLPVGAELRMWPEFEGYLFSPPECGWLQEPPLESIGAMFVADPQDRPGDSRGFMCESVP
jgi:hypothetical protein